MENGKKIIDHLGLDNLRQAIKYCMQDTTQESGGYILQLGELKLFEPLPNISQEPDVNLEFEKSINILNKIFTYQREGLAFIHSHVYQDEGGMFEASVTDMELANVDVLDWIIIDVQTQDLIFIGGHSDFSKVNGLVGTRIFFRL